VHPDYRRQGIGAIMAEAAQEWVFRLWGLKRLQCVVSLDNEPVVGLLEKMGGQARFVTYVKDVDHG
jgi:ribosomal protein S18 acetylase RimI-like enzyme